MSDEHTWSALSEYYLLGIRCVQWNEMKLTELNWKEGYTHMWVCVRVCVSIVQIFRIFQSSHVFDTFVAYILLLSLFCYTVCAILYLPSKNAMEAQLNYSRCVRTNTCMRWIQRHSNPSIHSICVNAENVSHTHTRSTGHTFTFYQTYSLLTHAHTPLCNGVFVVAFLKCFFGRFVRKIIVKTAQNPKLSLALSLAIIEISRILNVNRITSVYGWQRMDFFPYSSILYIHHIWFWDRSVCFTEYFPRRKKKYSVDIWVFFVFYVLFILIRHIR